MVVPKPVSGLPRGFGKADQKELNRGGCGWGGGGNPMNCWTSNGPLFLAWTPQERRREGKAAERGPSIHGCENHPPASCNTMTPKPEIGVDQKVLHME